MMADQSSPRLLLPLLVTLAGLVIFMAGQTWAGFNDHNTLSAVRDGQTKIMQQGVRMRQQLTALAGGVAQMAQTGDADAQAIVDQFARNGVKLAPPAQPGAK